MPVSILQTSSPLPSTVFPSARNRANTMCRPPAHRIQFWFPTLTVTSHVVLATCKQCLVCIQCNACCSSWRLRSASASMRLLTSSARVTRTCAGPQTTIWGVGPGKITSMRNPRAYEVHADDDRLISNCPSDRLHVLPVCPLPCTCLPISKRYFLHRVPNDRGRGRQVTNPLKEALFHWYDAVFLFFSARHAI